MVQRLTQTITDFLVTFLGIRCSDSHSCSHEDIKDPKRCREGEKSEHLLQRHLPSILLIVYGSKRLAFYALLVHQRRLPRLLEEYRMAYLFRASRLLRASGFGLMGCNRYELSWGTEVCGIRCLPALAQPDEDEFGHSLHLHILQCLC